jgi:hypothetical protein
LYNKPSPFGIIYEKISPDASLEQLKDNAYEVFSFKEKFADQVEHTFLPLDIAVVHTGKLHDTQKTNLLLKTDKKSFEHYQEFFHNYFDKKKDYHLNHLFKQKDAYDTVADLMSLLSLKTVYLMTKLFASGEEPEFINAFIDHINTLDDVSRVVEKTSHFGEDFRHYFRLHGEMRAEKV